MYIKQIIPIADVELIYIKLEKKLKKTSTILKAGEIINFLLVLLSIIFQLLALVLNHKAYIFLILSAQLISAYYHKIKKENWKKSKSILLLKKIKEFLPDYNEYSINVDESGIGVNDSLFINWQNVYCALLNEDYIVLSEKNKVAIPVKVDTESKKDICSKLDENNVTIISLNPAKIDAAYVKQTELRQKKGTQFVDKVAVIVLVVTLIFMIYGIKNKPDDSNGDIPKDITEQKYSAADFIYDPDKSFVVQMEDAYDLTENANYSFNLYFPYIVHQDYNTMIKIHKGTDESYAAYHSEVDVYFFDDVEFRFGLKMDSSYDTRTGNILYMTPDKAFYIKSNEDGTFKKNEMNSDFIDWKTKFYNILETDETTADKIYWSYKTNHGIAFSSGIGIYPDIIDFDYEFCENHVIHQQQAEYADEFIVMFRNIEDSEINNISELFETAVNSNSKVDFSELIEAINQYAIISIAG